MPAQNGPTVFVTGCTEGGIGYALCEEFAKKGAVVFATARRVEAMGKLADQGCILLPLDVTSQESVDTCVAEIIAHPKSNGVIDILVNNAGVGGSGPLLDFNIDEAKWMFEVNYFGLIRVTQAVAKHMGKRRSGTIVNIGSIMGNLATPWSGVYGSSKAAVHAATEILREEVRALNIKVFLVAPGGIKSNIADKYDNDNSITFPEGSFYASAAEGILMRARASQSGARTDTNVFARRVVRKALKRNPPTYLTLGNRSFQWWLLGLLPRGFVMRVLGWALKTNLVGRSLVAKS